MNARDELDITPTSAAAQLELLRDEAARKRCKITVHAPITGTYFKLTDVYTDAEVGRYDTLIALEDALINWVDDPNAPIEDDRDAAALTEDR